MQTPKIENKIEANNENQKIRHIRKRSINQKMINFNNNYNHEHLKTDINNDVLKYDSRTFKSERNSYNRFFNSNKIEFTPRNNNDKKPLIKNSLIENINTPKKEKQTTKEEEEIPILNINNEMKKKYSVIPLKNNNINYKINNNLNYYPNNIKNNQKPLENNNQSNTQTNFYNPKLNDNYIQKPLEYNLLNENNTKNNNYLNNRNDIISKEIYNNNNYPKNIKDNNIPFQKPKDLTLNLENQKHNNQKKFNYTPSTPNIKNTSLLNFLGFHQPIKKIKKNK